MKTIYLAGNKYQWETLDSLREEAAKYNIVIGYDCVIGEWCEIGVDCKIGDNCKIGNRCAIGNDCKISEWCVIGDNCKIGEWCVIGNDCKIGAYCVIGNDCKIGAYCVIEKGNIQVFYDLYKYTINAWTDTKTGTKWVRMGCFIRTVDEWDDGFWNNDKEFPEESEQGQQRLKAYQLVKSFMFGEGGE